MATTLLEVLRESHSFVKASQFFDIHHNSLHNMMHHHAELATKVLHKVPSWKLRNLHSVLLQPLHALLQISFPSHTVGHIDIGYNQVPYYRVVQQLAGNPQPEQPVISSDLR